MGKARPWSHSDFLRLEKVMPTEPELELKPEPLCLMPLPWLHADRGGLPGLGDSGNEWPLRLVTHRPEQGSWFNVGDHNYRASLVVTVPGSLVEALNCRPRPWRVSFSK